MQKYKVFWNDKEIVFAAPGKITLAKTSFNIRWDAINTDILNWMAGFTLRAERQAILEHDHPCEAFLIFRKAFRQINAAGGVVRRHGQMLVIFRNGVWDLPKGKIDEGESTEKAALREVEEECGISGHSIVRSLPSTFHVYKSPYQDSLDQWFFKETFWFEMDYDGIQNGSPEMEEGISEVRWVYPSELEEVLANTHENLKELIRMFDTDS